MRLFIFYYLYSYIMCKGCDRIASNRERISSLHIAVRYGRTDVVTLLLKEHVDPDVREKKYGRTAIHEAVFLANFQVLKVTKHRSLSQKCT